MTNEDHDCPETMDALALCEALGLASRDVSHALPEYEATPCD